MPANKKKLAAYLKARFGVSQGYILAGYHEFKQNPRLDQQDIPIDAMDALIDEVTFTANASGGINIEHAAFGNVGNFQIRSRESRSPLGRTPQLQNIKPYIRAAKMLKKIKQ